MGAIEIDTVRVLAVVSSEDLQELAGEVGCELIKFKEGVEVTLAGFGGPGLEDSEGESRENRMLATKREPEPLGILDTGTFTYRFNTIRQRFTR